MAINFTRLVFRKYPLASFHPKSPFMRPYLAIIVLVSSYSPIASHAGESAPRFSGNLGIGLASLQEYVGGGRARVDVASLIDVEMSTRLGTFALDQTGLSWSVVDTDAVRAGIFASYDPGRGTDSNNSSYRPGSSYLRGMGEIDATAEAGAFVGWTLGNVTTELSVRRALGGHDGTLAELSAGIPIYTGARLHLTIESSATWADTNYSRTYFGVTAEQAARSRFTAYQAGSGIQSAQLDLLASYSLTPRWSVLAMASYYSLIGDAADSPIVQKSRYPEFATFLVWNFGGR